MNDIKIETQQYIILSIYPLHVFLISRWGENVMNCLLERPRYFLYICIIHFLVLTQHLLTIRYLLMQHKQQFKTTIAWFERSVHQNQIVEKQVTLFSTIIIISFFLSNQQGCLCEYSIYYRKCRINSKF